MTNNKPITTTTSDYFEKALEVCPECGVKMVIRDTAYPEDGGPGEYWLKCYVCGWTKTEIIKDNQ